LSLAIKLHGDVDTPEGKHVKVALSTFVSLGRDQFTIEELKAKELDVLCALEWHVDPPTPLSFITLFMKLFIESWKRQPIDPELQTFVFELAVYLAMLSLSDSSFSFQFGASELAQAALRCAVDALEQVDSLKSTLRGSAMDNFLVAVDDAVTGIESVDNLCRKLKDMFLSLVQADGVPNDEKGPPKPDSVSEKQLACIWKHWSVS
jgi:hypothetical protein